jgi:hypothetical protein
VKGELISQNRRLSLTQLSLPQVSFAMEQSLGGVSGSIFQLSDSYETLEGGSIRGSHFH